MTQTLTKYSEPELNAAFRRVQDPRDWRNPIDCVVTELDRAELEKIQDAVEFYTATECKVTPLGGASYRITADGYRNGPAGP